MKTFLLSAIFTTLVLPAAMADPQTPEPESQTPIPPIARPVKDVTIRTTIIALPNAEATQFSAAQDFSGKPADALKTLEDLVGQKQAVSIANLAVTSKSGQRAVSESAKNTLEVEPVVSDDGTAADLNLILTNSGHKLITSVQVSNGGAKFLGSLQSPPDTKMTEYVFVRVSF